MLQNTFLSDLLNQRSKDQKNLYGIKDMPTRRSKGQFLHFKCVMYK